MSKGMSLQTILSILLFSNCLFNPILAGIFNSKGDIKVIDVTRLKKHLASSSKATMVAFFAPWCGHCRNLAPKYDAAATNVKNLVTFVAVDCDAKENSASCQTDYKVKGYPTILYFSGLPIPKPYEGAREPKELVNYALENMPNFSKKVKDTDQLAKLVAKSTPSRPLVVLFSKLAKVTPLYKALSSVLHKKFDVYFAPSATIDANTIKAEYDIEQFPKLIIFKGTQKSDWVPYKGEMTYTSLFAFFKSNTASEKDQDPTKDNQTTKKDDSTRKVSGEL